MAERDPKEIPPRYSIEKDEETGLFKVTIRDEEGETATVVMQKELPRAISTALKDNPSANEILDQMVADGVVIDREALRRLLGLK